MVHISIQRKTRDPGTFASQGLAEQFIVMGEQFMGTWVPITDFIHQVTGENHAAPNSHSELVPVWAEAASLRTTLDRAVRSGVAETGERGAVRSVSSSWLARS